MRPHLDETEEEKKLGNDFMRSITKPYMARVRDRFDGPRSIDQSLTLNEDFYCYTYLHWFKRRVLYNEDVDTDDEEEGKREASESQVNVNASLENQNE